MLHEKKQPVFHSARAALWQACTRPAEKGQALHSPQGPRKHLGVVDAGGTGPHRDIDPCKRNTLSRAR